MHTYFGGQNLLETIWFNLLTTEKIEENEVLTAGLGSPPWEKMPEGEDCNISKQLKNSYIGCLVAMSRFVLFEEQGIYYVEGIQYPSHKEGWREPSMAINDQEKNIRLLWVDPNKRPWRELTSLLSFINSSSEEKFFNCKQIKYGLDRIPSTTETFSIWSGGLRVSNNSGDQSVKKDDDFVESIVMLKSKSLGDEWYGRLKNEMEKLDKLSSIVFNKVKSYYKNQKADKKMLQDIAPLASNLFWQLCERKYQGLISICEVKDLREHKAGLKKIRSIFASYVYKAYDSFCPKETARQLDAWAKCRPRLGKYLNFGEETENG